MVNACAGYLEYPFLYKRPAVGKQKYRQWPNLSACHMSQRVEQVIHLFIEYRPVAHIDQAQAVPSIKIGPLTRFSIWYPIVYRIVLHDMSRRVTYGSTEAQVLGLGV